MRDMRRIILVLYCGLLISVLIGGVVWAQATAPINGTVKDRTATANTAHLDLKSATIADLNAAFKQGTLTAEKLTDLYLARIAALRQTRPGHQCGHLPQSKRSRRGQGPRRRAQGWQNPRPAPWRPRRPQGSLQHLRPAHDRRLAVARRFGPTRGRLCR